MVLAEAIIRRRWGEGGGGGKGVGRKPEYPEKTPGDELQKMPHTTARKSKPHTRLEPAF